MLQEFLLRLQSISRNLKAARDTFGIFTHERGGWECIILSFSFLILLQIILDAGMRPDYR
jgi:hypothetical protein